MIRRDFVSLLGAAAAWPLTVRAQRSESPVVGWLNPQPLETSRDLFQAFRKGLAETGFVEGRGVTIELRPGDGKRERLPELAADLVRRGVAAIMAGSPPAALAAARATQTIPVVFTSGADPVRIGLVSSFNRPGGNVTGIHIQYAQLVGKRLELLHETVPQVVRIAVLANPDNPSDREPTIRNATEAAQARGLDVRAFDATTIDQIDAAFAALVAWGAGAVLIQPDPLLASRTDQIVALATRHALPSSFFGSNAVSAGGLMSYGPDNSENYRLAGVYVGRILKGEQPGDLPIQRPTKFELAINLETAKALGISVPESILFRADKIVE